MTKQQQEKNLKHDTEDESETWFARLPVWLKAMMAVIMVLFMVAFFRACMFIVM